MSTMSESELADLKKEERSAMRGTIAQFAVLLLAPLLALLGLASVLLYKELDGLWKIDRVQSIAALTVQSSEIILALQRERGMSAGFIASKGAQFAEPLAAQRRETDSRLSRSLSDFLDTPISAASTETVARLQVYRDVVRERMKGLVALRQRVDALEATIPEMAEHYTTAINALLDFNAGQNAANGDSEANTVAAAKHLVAQAMEYSGLERAAGAQGFSQQMFPRVAFNKMQRLIAKQEALLHQFRTIAPPKFVRRMDEALASSPAQSVETYRNAAAQSVGDKPHGASAEQWFEASTGRITQLDTVRRELSAHFDRITQRSSDTLVQEMLVNLVVVLVTLVLSNAIMFWRSYNIASALLGLSRSVQRMSRGLTDVWVKGTDRRDMVGLLARSMTRITRQGEQNTQVRSALAVSKSQIMITDATGGILFLNGSLEASAEESMDYFFEVLPDFDPFSMYEHLLDLVKNALAQAGATLEGLDRSQEVDVRYADRTFEVTITPVSDTEGRSAGHTIEWREVTASRAIEEQVAEMIAATRQGDFSRQISISTSQKFLSDVAEGMNAISEQVATFMADLKIALQALADGDLTRRVDQSYAGDLADLAEATNTTIDRLQVMVAKITEGGVAIESQSTAIRDGALQLAAKSEEAASTLEETSAAMEEVSGGVKATANFATDADAAANSARQSAERGGEVVTKTVDAMHRIQQSSKEIVDILSVIDGIAFQTNLLALNAAVEAARAGEAGKGFAVVASEVRALAQNSGDAAQKIKDLIAASTTNVDDGVRLVAATGDALSQIRSAVADTSEKIAEISRSAHDQSISVQEIASAVALLDDMTQQNARVAEHNASASRLMATQSADLAELVTQFRSDESAPREEASQRRDLDAWEDDAHGDAATRVVATAASH